MAFKFHYLLTSFFFFVITATSHATADLIQGCGGFVEVSLFVFPMQDFLRYNLSLLSNAQIVVNAFNFVLSYNEHKTVNWFKSQLPCSIFALIEIVFTSMAIYMAVNFVL